MTDTSNTTTTDVGAGDDISFAARICQLAGTQGDAPAVTVSGETTNYRQLDSLSNQTARYFQSLGVQHGDMVTIAEPNSLEFILALVACWKLGANPQPVSSKLPGMELEQIVELADSRLVVGFEVPGRQSLAHGYSLPGGLDDSPLPDAVSPAWKVPTSGGSTGRPKLIAVGDPSMYSEKVVALSPLLGAAQGAAMIVPGPVFHNLPLSASTMALLAGGHLVLSPRFDAQETLRQIQDHAGRSIAFVPTMMQRMCKLPDEVKKSYDISSMRFALHTAEPCPVWVKEEWIDWIGGEHLWEIYGGTEGQSYNFIGGTEWLDHKGSVGKPVIGEVKICDENGNDLPLGEIGDVYMRSVGRDKPSYYYIGAEPETIDGGWETLGDMGYMDAEGYLFLADRRKDMILVGGENVYPAEIEAALSHHPKVASAAVIGLPDEDKGNRVHAIVQPAEGVVLEGDHAVDDEELLEFLTERLAKYKLPRTIEWTDEPLRSDAGKVRRSALRAERVDS